MYVSTRFRDVEMRKAPEVTAPAHAHPAPKRGPKDQTPKQPPRKAATRRPTRPAPSPETGIVLVDGRIPEGTYL